MRHATTAIASAIVMLAAIGVARADCESDMFQLEQAMKTPNLSAAALW